LGSASEKVGTGIKGRLGGGWPKQSSVERCWGGGRERIVSGEAALGSTEEDQKPGKRKGVGARLHIMTKVTCGMGGWREGTAVCRAEGRKMGKGGRPISGIARGGAQGIQ